MAFESRVKTSEEINWDEVNYNKGQLGMVREFNYKDKTGVEQVGKCVNCGTEMIESILRDMKKFGEGSLTIFINEKQTTKGLKQILSFKVDEKFVKTKTPVKA